MFSRSSGRHRFEATTGSALNNMRGWHGSKRLSPREALQLLAATTLHGNLPEPLRLAHLIAGGITTGKSRGRA